MNGMKTQAGTIAAALVLFTTAEAHAIPAWARNYKTSCNTCHVMPPKLNDFGEAFRLNGFKIPPDDELLVKDEPVALGAEALRQEWPDQILPSTIPWLPPISVWVRWGFTQEEGGRKVDFGQPSLAWLLGANVGSHLSFFMELGPKQRAYFKIDDVFNNPLFGEWLPERLIDLRAGLLEPEVVGFSDARRIPITEHIVYNASYRLPNGNGNPFELERQIGAELMGIVGQRFRYVVGVTNGSNDGSDNNSKKDIYYRAAYKLWGMAFTGREEVEESLEATKNWTDNSVTLGAFGYHGFNDVPDAMAPGTDYSLDFVRFGADLRANWGDLDLALALVWGEDENAANDGVDVGVLSGLVEADYMILPWLMGYVKFEWLDFRGPNASQLDAAEVRRVVPGITARIYPNFRVTAEYKFEEDLHGISRDDAFLFRIDIDF